MGRCSKDKRDVFYRLAKEEGWRARSVFKLMQIDNQFGIFDNVTRAVDLCAAPGSWSQVLARELFKNARQDAQQTKIVAVDIQTMAPIDNVNMIQGDITETKTAEKVINELGGSKAQLVVCDGAPDVTGQHELDYFLQSQLLLAALNITTFILEERGTFVAKIFRVEDISLMRMQFEIFFKQVNVVKPSSSRSSSIEAFIVCKDFQLPKNYTPHMFNLSNCRQVADSQKDTKSLIPFICCGDMYNGAEKT